MECRTERWVAVSAGLGPITAASGVSIAEAAIGGGFYLLVRGALLRKLLAVGGCHGNCPNFYFPLDFASVRILILLLTSVTIAAADRPGSTGTRTRVERRSSATSNMEACITKCDDRVELGMYVIIFVTSVRMKKNVNLLNSLPPANSCSDTGGEKQPLI
jgi:hypothetical protein